MEAMVAAATVAPTAGVVAARNVAGTVVAAAVTEHRQNTITIRVQNILNF